MTYIGSPQYLKNIQKIQRLQPNQKAIIRPMIDALNSLYAGEEMRKQLQSMKLAAQDKARERQYTLGKGRLGLRREELDETKAANKTAETLGWINLPLSGLRGLEELQHKRKLGKIYNRMASLYRD